MARQDIDLLLDRAKADARDAGKPVRQTIHYGDPQVHNPGQRSVPTGRSYAEVLHSTYPLPLRRRHRYRARDKHYHDQSPAFESQQTKYDEPEHHARAEVTQAALERINKTAMDKLACFPS
jgi:hypothetical protein